MILEKKGGQLDCVNKEREREREVSAREKPRLCKEILEM